MASFQTYIDIINPNRFKETIDQQSKSENWNGVFANLVVLIVIFLASDVINSYFEANKIGVFSISATQTSFQASSYMYTPLGLFIGLMIEVIEYFLFALFIHLLSKALGGKGSYGRLMWLYSIVEIPMSLLIVLLSAFFALFFNPLVCLVYVVLGISFVLYAFYLYYTIVRTVHPSLNRERTIAAIVLSFALYYLASYLFDAARVILRI